MTDRLKQLLDHLAKVVDPSRQAEIEQLHRRALRWEPVKRLPLVLAYPTPADTPFQPHPHGRTIDDPAKMLYNELVCGFDSGIAFRDRIDDDLPLTIRANVGTVLVASLFGACVEQVGDNPPWVRHFKTLDEFQSVLDCDPLDFTRGWCPRLFDRYQFYRHTLDSYPELARIVHVVLPDLQGPLDTAELLRGSEIYVDLYRNPEIIADVLQLAARAQVGLAKALAPYTTDASDGFTHQHGMLIRGNILIRNDSALMISPSMYRQFVAPNDEMVLREMGGGGIHSCGKCEHNIEAFCELPSLHCLDLGQPEMNDLDAIYAKSRERRIALDGVRVPRDELTTGRVMQRFPTGMSLCYEAESLRDAQEVLAAYRQATE